MGHPDWREVTSDDVDIVDVTRRMRSTIDRRGGGRGWKDIFCEKPVGISPEATAATRRGRHAGISGCGYNYRWAPLVQYTRGLIADGG
jgi:hypothetical protein